jgi:thiosulfate/3-mercaptopyruvate sulfurtransferase
MENPFVTTDWLAAHLGDAKILPIDASWFLPAANRKPQEEFLAGHIPGAVYFDIDGVADHSTGLPHMLLAPDAFANAVGALGIGDGMTLVIYDEAGLFSAPRAWWEFLIMGAPEIRILEGGGPKWRAEGLPLESGASKRPPTVFTPHFRPELLTDRTALATWPGQVADARPAGRFAGRDPEPRPGLRSGHMPKALSVPASDLVADGRLRPIAELRALFDKAGIDLNQPLATTCGSGVTASTLMLGLRLAGAKNVALYDGSWAEWGARDDTVVLKD